MILPGKMFRYNEIYSDKTKGYFDKPKDVDNGRRPPPPQKPAHGFPAGGLIAVYKAPAVQWSRKLPFQFKIFDFPGVLKSPG